jgi:hypothetical protein
MNDNHNGIVPKFQAFPPQGRPLPKQWKQDAPSIAAAATEAYMDRLQNAWRRGYEGEDCNDMRKARLSPPGPLSWNDVLGQK